jgi:hypothetical protein
MTLLKREKADGPKKSCPYAYKHPPNGMDMLRSILRKKEGAITCFALGMLVQLRALLV